MAPKEQAMSQTIKPESSVSLIILAAVVMAIFTLFITVEPSFQQIEVNRAKIKSNRSLIDAGITDQRAILKHLITVSGALQRIEGRVEGSTISQGQ